MREVDKSPKLAMYWPLWGLALALLLSNKRGGGNKRGGSAKVFELINKEEGINEN